MVVTVKAFYVRIQTSKEINRFCSRRRGIGKCISWNRKGVNGSGVIAIYWWGRDVNTVSGRLFVEGQR